MLTWLEDGGDANGTADTLGEEDLVVLSRDGRHHQAKDVKKRPANDEPTRAVLVVDETNYRTQGHHEEDLQRGDPRNGTSRVLFENRSLVVVLEHANTFMKLLAWSSPSSRLFGHK